MAEPALVIQLTEETYPPHDPLHGTPNAMVRRLATVETGRGRALWEQTDYGHPGRFNDWEPREMPAALQPRFALLKAAVQAAGALLG